MPSAYEMEELHAFKGAEGDHTVEIHAVDTNPFAAQVFKTHSEPHVGDVSFFRIFSGQVVQRAGGVQRHARRRGEDRPPVRRAGEGAHRSPDAARRRHRLRRQAQEHAHQRHAVDARASGAAAADPRSPSRWCRSRCTRPRGTTRKSCSRDCIGCTTRTRRSRRTTTPRRTRRSSPDSGERHLEVVDGEAQAKVRRVAELTKPRIAVSRDDHRPRRRAGTAQEADGRPRPVRRLLDPHGAASARRRLPLRRRDRRRRRFPSKFIPAVDKGIQEAAARGHPRRLSAGRLRGRALRRLVPLGRLQRNVVQDGRHPRRSRPVARSASRCCSSRSTRWRSRRLTSSSATSWATSAAARPDPRHRFRRRWERAQSSRRIVPQAELHLYATDLNSITHGHGTYSRRLSSYEQMPARSSAEGDCGRREKPERGSRGGVDRGERDRRTGGPVRRCHVSFVRRAFACCALHVSTVCLREGSSSARRRRRDVPLRVRPRSGSAALR